PIADTNGGNGTIADGVYLYRAMLIDLAGNVGPMGPGLVVTIDANGPAIGPPALTDATDTGRPRPPRDTDNITRLPEPDFQGTAEPNATVTLFVNGAAAGTTQADPTGFYLITAEVPLAEGLNSVTVQETD